MKLDDFLTEEQLDEFNVGKAIGKGVGALAYGAGAVAGGAVGSWDAAKKGFAAGRKTVAGDDEEPLGGVQVPQKSMAQKAHQAKKKQAAQGTSQSAQAATPNKPPAEKKPLRKIPKQAEPAAQQQAQQPEQNPEVQPQAQQTLPQTQSRPAQPQTAGSVFARVKQNIDKLDAQGKKQVLEMLLSMKKSKAPAQAKPVTGQAQAKPGAAPAATPAKPVAKPVAKPGVAQAKQVSKPAGKRKVNQNIKESLQQDEFYVWTVHFQDGTATKVRIRYDETSQEDLERHFKKPIAKIDYNWGIQGGDQIDRDVADKWQKEQDRLERQKSDQRFGLKELAPAGGDGGDNYGGDLHDILMGFIGEYYPEAFDEFGQDAIDGVVADMVTMGMFDDIDPNNEDDLEDAVSQIMGQLDDGDQIDQEIAEKWLKEDDSPIKPGDQIRTKKMQMDGVVERIGKNRAGYDEVFFKIHDGRIMKTPLDNVSKVEKLNDEDDEMLEGRYVYDKKTASMRYDNSDPDQRHSLFINGKLVKTYGSREEAENVKARDVRFRNAEIKKTVPEGMMGGINRAAPAQDVSYENMLDDVYESVLKKWKNS